MPPVIAAAAITAGAGIYSAVSASRAAGKASRAQAAASQQQLAAQQAALDRVQGLQQPFITGGGQGFDALLRELGLSGTSTTARAPSPQLQYDAAGNVRAAPQAQPGRADAGIAKRVGGFAGTSPLESSSVPGKDAAREIGRPAPITEAPRAAPAATPATAATPQGTGGPDWNAYLSQNPDVAAQAAKEGRNPVEYAQQHYQVFGQNEGRALPTSAPPAPAAEAQTQPDPNAPPDLTNAARPGASLAPEFERGADIEMGDYGSAPGLDSFFDNFEEDPGAAFRKSEALNGVNAYSAARGKLRSGDAAKALMGRASDLASQEYGNWFNRQMQKYNASRGAFENDRSFSGNMWQAQQGRADKNFADDRGYGTGMWQFGVDRGDQNFNVDRAYQTGREDTRIGNLFDVARLGSGAAATVGGAAQNFANNASSIYGSQANAASDAAYNRAAANSYAVNGVANAASNLFTRWGGGSGGGLSPVAAPQTVGSAWGFQSAANPTFVNTPANIRF